jgi:hypothetical protein
MIKICLRFATEFFIKLSYSIQMQESSQLDGMKIAGIKKPRQARGF